MGTHHASHLSVAFNPQNLKETAEHLAAKIRQDAQSFAIEAIAVQGLSGITVGSVVSMLTGIPLAIVRKHNPDHSMYRVEFAHGFYNYVIVDDFISSGTTVMNIVERVKSELPSAQCQKMYAYKYVYAEGIMTYVHPDSKDELKGLLKRYYGFHLEMMNRTAEEDWTSLDTNPQTNIEFATSDTGQSKEVQ